MFFKLYNSHFLLLFLGVFTLTNFTYAGPNVRTKYIEKLTGLSGKDAQEEFKRIRVASKKIAFLDCPLEMIERQWNGSQSVLDGARFLSRFIDESEKSLPFYGDIARECKKKLNWYRNEDQKARIQAREISDLELASLKQDLALFTSNTGLFSAFVQSVNQPTLCQTKRVATKLAFGVGGSVGYYQIKCITPWGRRFILSGPSVGFGMGVIASVLLPSSNDLYQAQAYKLLLYKEKEKKWRQSDAYSGDIAVGMGITWEGDESKQYTIKENTDDIINQIEFNEVLPSVGLGAMYENFYNFTQRKDIAPIYGNLSRVIDIQALTRTFIF